MESFDWKFYLNLYDDISYIKDENNALNHYILNGKNENRICNKKAFHNFDWKFYVCLYDDISFIKDENNAIKHYILNGEKENRLYNKNNFKDFDWNFYVCLYDDIGFIKDENNAIKHYILNGNKENRIINKISFQEFDWKFYVFLYDDIFFIKDENSALKHYILNGKKENRIINKKEYQHFDWKFYKYLNEHILTIHEENSILKHYILYEKKENMYLYNLKIYQGFDYENYIFLNNDLKNISNKKEAYNHFIKYGLNENRIYNKIIYNNFDWQFYIQFYKNLDFIKNKKEAFIHYLKIGINENRIFNKKIYDCFDYDNYIFSNDSNKVMINKEIAFHHFINKGIFENKMYNKEMFDFFDSDFYKNLYDDLYYLQDKIHLFNHYIVIGINENRIFNITQKIYYKINNIEFNTTFEHFDFEFYTSFYEDLSIINTKKNAFIHWMKNKDTEERFCDPEVYRELTKFDYEFYINLNENSKEELNTIEKAYNHWINFKNNKVGKINYMDNNNIFELQDIYENKDFNSIDYIPTFEVQILIDKIDYNESITNEYMDNNNLKETYTNEDINKYIINNDFKEDTNEYVENNDFKEDTNEYVENNDFKEDTDEYVENNNLEESYTKEDSHEYIENNNSIYDMKPTNKTFITFIIPTIGRESLLNTIDSLENLYDTDWKAILLFDGIKNTFNINNEKITILEIEKKGEIQRYNRAGAVRNIGFQHVNNSEWIGFVDDDDLLAPNYINKLKEEIQLNKNIEVCIFRMAYENKIVLPSNYDKNIIKCRVGISFALKSYITEKVIFYNNQFEDYYFLKELEYKNYEIVISPSICYFVKSEIYDIENKYDRVYI